MANPNLMVLHKPTQHFEEKAAANVLDVFKEFCACRGVGMSSADVNYRRPRSVVMSTGSKQSIRVADLVLALDSMNSLKGSSSLSLTPNSKTNKRGTIVALSKEEVPESMIT